MRRGRWGLVALAALVLAVAEHALGQGTYGYRYKMRLEDDKSRDFDLCTSGTMLKNDLLFKFIVQSCAMVNLARSRERAHPTGAIPHSQRIPA
ncbi:hypothetical protein EVAR_5850_1 [Eumeta japonica]|uniref:Uncharacterized protein n=1 Tax=Eumeta variegata TaxID=151549 RepID=A0A4C1TD22_EUMVA|nr:hypothetical protein EVAR_5850_1 [Eumeta japonica]